jgi:hypothetical protein
MRTSNDLLNAFGASGGQSGHYPSIDSSPIRCSARKTLGLYRDCPKRVSVGLRALRCSYDRAV